MSARGSHHALGLGFVAGVELSRESSLAFWHNAGFSHMERHVEIQKMGQGKLRISLVFAMLSMLVALPLSADSGGRLEAARQLLVVTEAERHVEQAAAGYDAMFTDLIRRMGIAVNEKELVRQRQYYRDLMAEKMSWAELAEPMAAIYAKHYNEQELHDIIAFYQSDSGRALLSKSDRVMQEVAALSYAKAEALMHEVITLIKAINAAEAPLNHP